MNIAILSPTATEAAHFETELELAQLHLDAGDSVTVISCTGQLENCDSNIDRSPERCQSCIGRRKMGWELVSADQQRPNTQPLLQITPQRDELRLNFDHLQSLMDYRIDDFDIGYAALSSLVSVIRDPDPDLLQHRDLLNRFLTTAWQSYENTLRFLTENQIDRVYNFNGRFAAMRGVLRACEKMGVDCYMHERGCDKDHYEVFPKHLPHDIPSIHKAILNRWDNGDPETRNSIGAQWFIDRVNRVESSWKSFVKNQEPGALPANFDSTRKNVGIFCSSDDEFVSIGDCWQNKLYPNQVTAIASIAKSMMESQPDTHLYLRVHPNLADVDNQRKRELMNLRSPNLTLIAPEATIDTYGLMKACDITMSFGSSVGIEAVYWNKPSILLGPCFYQDLPGPVRVTSHEHTIDLLTAAPTLPADSSGAIQYGYWFQTRGTRFRYYDANTLFDGKFKGQVVYARPPRRNLLQKIRDRIARVA